ncbi:protein ADM2a [Diretmus argenteus]
MQSLLPLAVYCISLVSLQQLLLALPVEERLERNRSNLLMKLSGQREEEVFTPGTQDDVATPPSAVSHSPKWLPGFLSHAAVTGARASLPSLAWARPARGLAAIQRRSPRGRRHAHTGSRGGHHHAQHAQLMRVGCVLGTCQVQNLSHRLYQLIGQSGREDSSPINPRSPHSYG